MDSVWTALGNRLETAWKRPTKPNSKRPKDGEIIDEEKSVRWNREEVVRRQKAWDAECSRLKKAQNAEIEHISESYRTSNSGRHQSRNETQHFQKGCNHPLAKSLRPWPRLWLR